jgi:hypothetical protein
MPAAATAVSTAPATAVSAATAMSAATAASCKRAGDQGERTQERESRGR